MGVKTSTVLNSQPLGGSEHLHHQRGGDGGHVAACRSWQFLELGDTPKNPTSRTSLLFRAFKIIQDIKVFGRLNHQPGFYRILQQMICGGDPRIMQNQETVSNKSHGCEETKNCRVQNGSVVYRIGSVSF